MKNQMIFQRYESKYLMTLSQQQTVLAAMRPYMEPDVYSHSSIRNLYLDTPDFRLIRRSLERPVYKEKLRIRSYGRAENTDMVFVELKKKYRSVVYKRRISLPQDQALACFSKTRPWPDSQIGTDVVIQGSTSQQKLCANVAAQIVAFACGKADDNRNKNFEGGRPSSIIIGDQLTPKTLGALLAHFENKVMFQGFAWNVNSFDQEGVQLGKVLAKRVLAHETDGALKVYSDLLNI